MAGTKTRRPKKKPKLRGGTNQSADKIPTPDEASEIMDAADILLDPDDDPADLDLGEEELPPTVSDEIGRIVDSVVPANGHADTLPPDHPDRLAEWDAKTIRLVNASAREVAELRADHETKAEWAKEAKKKWELAVADHFKLVDERKASRGKPVQGTLFDKTHGHAAAQPDLREPSEVPPVEDESWKKVPLTDLVEHDGLPAKVAELLAEADHKDRGKLAPITTMGELVKYQEPEESGYTKRLNDLKGIGPAKVDAISDATMRFWARWKPHANPTGPEDAGASGAAGDAGAGGEPGAAPADSPPGGDATRPAEPEPAAAPEPESNGEPAGYHTEGTETIAKRARGRGRKAKG